MAQQIKLKRSAIAGKVPTTSSLDTGELAINTADGKLYFVRDDGTVQTLVTTNALVTGSLNINGPITGSDIRINQWGSVSASLSTISSQAATVPTLDQVTDQGSSTTNFIEVGSISTSTTGGFIAGVFKTTDGLNTVILESAGTGGTNPGSTILQFRDSKGTQTNGAITYGGNAGDYLRLNTSAGTVFGITGSGVNSTYVFTGNNSGTGSFSWDLNTTFIQKVGGGTTQFLGNATTATTAISASLAATASIATSATSATRASTVSVSGINTDASYTFPLIVTGSSGPSIGLNIDTVNVGIIYNPSTNLFRATNLSATGSLLGTASYASDADLLDGQHGSYYLDASNINAGTIGDAYLPATISSDITGNAATATTASFALTASYAANVPQTASYALAALSASYATTASYAQNLVISGSISTVDYIDFSTTATVTQPVAGRVSWNSGDGTLDLGLDGGATTIQLGQSQAAKAYNAEATSLTKGEVVYISGSQGQRIAVKRAVATAELGSANTIGIVTETITAGAEGYILTEGQLKGLNTSAYTAGALLYLSTASGQFTETSPTAPNHRVTVGFVERVHASAGSIYVKIDNGYEIDELHNVLINGVSAGDLLVRSGSVWHNSKTLSGSYILTGSLTATGQFIGSLNGNAATATTASYALTASAVNQLNQNVTINGNLTVFGSSSFTYVTSSQLNVDDSFISVNVFEPAERFGGLKVYDSGSFSHQATASLAWDSQRNHWVYVNASGSTYSGGGLLSGPRNTGSLGDETYPSYNTVVRGQGGDHLYDSNIKDNDTAVQVGIPLQVTGSLTTSGKVNIETVDNYGSDPDKFLAIVSNEVVYRTGAQLLSDIGGQTAGTFVQNAGGGGQARYILRYEDSNSATTSSIYEDTSGRIGINRTTPAYPLDISGSNLQIGSVVVGRGLTPNTALVVGSGSLTVFTGSSSLTVYGNNTLTNLTTGFANDAFGAYALNLTSTGTYNSAFGQSAGRRNNGSNNVFFGQFSGPFYHTLTGGFNVFIGPLAGIYSSGSAAKNSGIGHSALYNLSDGIENTAIGSAALFDLTAGSGNIAFGYNTGRGITTGTGNVIVGNGITGLSSTLSNNIIIGDGQGNIKYRYADHNTTISGSLSIQGTTTVVQQGILVSGTTSLTVASISTGSYEGAFLDYVITSGSNKRAGTLTTVWTPSAIEWNDASTLDLGSTAGAEFTPALIGPNADLVLAVPAGTWTVKGHLRYM